MIVPEEVESVMFVICIFVNMFGTFLGVLFALLAYRALTKHNYSAYATPLETTLFLAGASRNPLRYASCELHEPRIFSGTFVEPDVI